ncbi:MAG: DoxX family protein [Candidatus Omnitrophica bacterium]|nr:DoxX family protein [Candidatus Omnitrophota bacterium]
MRRNILLFIRVLLGVLFIVSGGEKAVGPSENFLYVIQAYQILPDPLAQLASVFFPWAELFIGLSILLGIWLDVGLIALAGVSCSLILMVGQAIVRNLPIDSCGCFGSLVHLPLRGVIILDVTVLVSTLFCLRNIDQARWLSLDNYFVKTRS